MNDQLNPLVSIIIPVCNRAGLIGETLDSVLAQTYQNWECIIVDDGSTDDTKSVVQKYVDKDSRFKLYDRPESHKPGGNGARNYGIKMSSGGYIMFLDSDDLLSTSCLSVRITSILGTDLHFAVFKSASFIDNIDNNMLKIFNKYYDENLIYLKNFFILNSPWNILCPFYKLRDRKNFLLFDENLQRFQDIDFHIRSIITAQQNFKIFSNLNPDTFYRLNEKHQKEKLSSECLVRSFEYFVKKHYIDNNYWTIELNIQECYIQLFRNAFFQIFIKNNRAASIKDLDKFIKIYKLKCFSTPKGYVISNIFIFYFLFMTARFNYYLFRIPKFSKLINFLLNLIKS